MAAGAQITPPPRVEMVGTAIPRWRRPKILTFWGGGNLFFIFILFFRAVVRELTHIIALTGPLQLGPAAGWVRWTHSMAEFNSITRCYAFEVETHIITKK